VLKRKKNILLSLSCILILLFTGSITSSIRLPHSLDQTNDQFSSILDDESTEGWYFLPSYDNYAPSGLPDFDQRQHLSWKKGYVWAFCGPVALADIFWWFDSKHEDEQGTPGDGNDTYPLVSIYNTPSTPYPGPTYDDHNFNNVNDVNTPWTDDSQSGELIERIATYVNIYWHNNPFFSISGTDRFHMVQGAKQWIKDAGLENNYKIENIAKPSFSLILDRVQKNQGVILHGGFYIPGFPKFISLISGHYFAVAGVHPDGYISISDPLYDIQQPTMNFTRHNDPQYVSHDTFQISTSPPIPSIAKWWIPQFERHRRILIRSAIIISEIK